MKYKSTEQVMKIIKNKNNIRNFGVIAHVDHGKTTMSDSLLANSGIIAPSAAGKALALDSMKQEQERGITIVQANITLHFSQGDQEYVINMIDTPGHIDFSGRVIRSLRAIDGALVVCDAVEGIMSQTETVTRMALEERVKPVLFINKIADGVTQYLDEVSGISFGAGDSLVITPTGGSTSDDWSVQVIADIQSDVDDIEIDVS